jgi:8-oxo-dGTP diphosphatase
MKYCYEYPRAAVTVDCVIFGFDLSQLSILLIRRKLAPFKHKWALPGGFVRVDETLEQAADRELREETGLADLFLEQLYSFGDLRRDPRERVISIAYYGLVKPGDQLLRADTDASDARWFSMADDLPSLAFDHKLILECAWKRLQAKMRYQPIGFELLPEKFTLSQLQKLYEVILNRQLDKRNFRKKIMAMQLLIPLEEFQTGLPNRSARLYQFDGRKYRKLEKEGLLFEV